MNGAVCLEIAQPPHTGEMVKQESSKTREGGRTVMEN